MAKKVTTPTARRAVAHYACGWGLSQRQACTLVGLARNSYASPPGGGRGGIQPADAELMGRLQALVTRHSGWGFWKYYYRLRKQGVRVNHKRLWRIYQAMSLQLGRRRKKKRLPERVKRPLEVPAQPNVCWSLDFMESIKNDNRNTSTGRLSEKQPVTVFNTTLGLTFTLSR